MEQVTLERECAGTLIPDGIEATLPAGSQVWIAQALGGAVTVRTDSGLYRIAPADLDALGSEVAGRLRATQRIPERGESTEDSSFSEEHVWEALRHCYDPEIPLNIVDLGLVYDLAMTEGGRGQQVAVKMTLTAQGCGMGPAIAADAKSKIESLPEVEHADVEIVWDPQWTPHMISAEGRKVLGLD